MIAARVADLLTRLEFRMAQAAARHDNQHMTKCDYCGESFEIELKAEPTPEGGEYQFFSCPHCGAGWPVAWITAHGLRLRGRLKLATERGESPKEIAKLRASLEREVKKRQCPPDRQPNPQP